MKPTAKELAQMRWIDRAVDAMKNPRPHIWLREHEESGKFDNCACRLEAEYATPGYNGSPAFFMCPLHEAAPEMLKMLYDNESAWDGEEESVRREHSRLISRLKAVIKKAEGV